MARDRDKGDDLDSVLQELGLEAAERRLLARALGVAEKDSAAMLERVRVLRSIALKEFVDWMLGRTRFNSTSESDMHRLIDLFLRVRKEPPTIDAIVSQLSLPATRAANLLGRMRYGEGRLLTSLAAKAAALKLETNLASATTESGDRKSVFVDADTLAYIRGAAMQIMSQPGAHNKGAKYQGAQMPEFTSYGRDGGLAKTTTTMWRYVLDALKADQEQA